MKNQEVVRILNGIADILEIQEVPFKPQAYRKAALAIESLAEDVEDIYKEKGTDGLLEIPSVGENIAKKIEEIITTGKLKYHEQLKKAVDIDVEALGMIPGLGPKKINILHKQLNIKTVEDLEKVLQQQKIRELEGFGEKTEETLLQGIKFYKSKPKRFLYAQALPIVHALISYMKQCSTVLKIEVAGSFRRGKETVGDIDLLVTSSSPQEVMKKFVAFPDRKEIIAQGTTKSSLRLSNGMQVDLRVVKEKEFGSALQYFIGNKDHNVELRKFALSKGYTLSEYGLFTVKGKKWLAGKTEQEIYQKLEMAWIEPELRENHGEIAAALHKKLPTIVTTKDIQGSFHNHSTWSDGANSLLAMAQKAEDLGWKFISFNDHFGPIGITNPLTEKRLSSYLKEIEHVRKKVGIRVFSGIEIDILKDGTLPLSAKKLKELDIVVASVHLSMKMTEADMTRRVCSVLQNYPIHILGHPTGRLLNIREGMQLNFEEIFRAARDNHVFLEINSSPQRMDLQGELIKQAKDIGCQFALSTDAHEVSQLHNYPFGVNMARRGWLEKKDLLNCWEMKKIEKALEK